MNEYVLPVASILERDIDLLLLEELATDDTFCEWLIAQLNLPILSSVRGAWKSISAFGLGETDILFSYQSNEKTIVVLIENKLDASFQNEQFSRYHQRAEKYVAQKTYSDAFILLIAPKLYCIHQREFEYCITYESISERLQQIGTKRSLFKSHLLQIAIEKLRRGYQPINSIPVQQFWHAYWQYQQKYFPEFSMKEPKTIPFKSDWPILFDTQLKNIQFYHKLSQGFADATCRDSSTDILLKIKKQLPNWASIQIHGKSFSIRVIVEPIDRTTAFTEQVNAVDNGLQNLQRIKNWIHENIHLFDV